MSAPRSTAIALTGIVITLAACSISTKVTRYSGIWVHGVVSSEAGTAVPGAEIRAGYRPMDACSTAGFGAHALAPSTDNTGAYGVGIVDTGAPHAVCIKIVATPPTDWALAAESAFVGNVMLSDNMLADSVRIDIVLPPR